MTPERWQQVKTVFRSALAYGAGQRSAFLDQACAGDPELRREVESLLAYDERAGDFIQAPAAEVAAELLAEARAESMVGRRIGPYQVTREIGRGGMGVVYLAERSDGVYRKQVAVKLVPRGAERASVLERFRRERQILAVLDHANIAKLLDGGTTDDGLPYFVMDYVQGLPIDAYCDRHRLSVVERLKLFCRVCSAVHYAHKHGVVHRDLKPSNILVTAQGEPKLLDFGIAKPLDPEFALARGATTAAGLRPMTPEYASPEQVRGAAITTASDIYSLGVLLYELLTGHRPYHIQSHTPQEIERVICEQDPEKPSRIIGRVEQLSSSDGITPITRTPESVSASRSDQPEKLRRRLAGDLDNIVLMALHKEPERRYTSVEQFSEDIGRHLEGLPVIARKDTLWYRSAKFVKRRKAHVVAVALLVLVVLGLYLLTRIQKATDTTIDSIAVLPFVNASGNPNMEYLSDGITESLINSLSQLPKQRVVPRSSVFRYKGQEVDPQRVGRDLGVRAVLMGRVLQQGGRLRIQAELIDVKDVSQLWGEHYNREPADLVAVQEEISQEISSKLRRKLSREEKRLLTKRYTENSEAHQAYLKGRYFWNKRTAEGYKKAIEFFQQAIEKDPHYALAHAGLADSYLLIGGYGTVLQNESIPKAKAAAEKALAIDDTLAEAHTSLGLITQNYDWDWARAEREYRRAIELNPSYATAHHWYGEFLSLMGRFDEAISEIRQAQALDPLSLIINTDMGKIFCLARQYDRAIEQLRKTLEMDPSFVLVYEWLVCAYIAKGMYEEALAACQKFKSLDDGPLPLAWEGAVYAYWEKRAEAQKVIGKLKEMSKHRYVWPVCLATIYAGLGEKDQAMAWLEKEYEVRGTGLIWLKIWWGWDSVRSDPRFTDLVRRVGLPP